MALGIFQQSGTISTNTDTAIAPAPGVGQRIHILWVTLTVGTAGTSSRAVITEGTGGAPLGRLATATADSILNINYGTGFRDFPGRILPENTAVTVTTSGTGAATINYDIAYMVKG